MHIQYKKQAVKYINTCDKPTKNRLKEAIEKKLTVQAAKFSKSAVAAIEAAGGKTEVI